MEFLFENSDFENGFCFAEELVTKAFLNNRFGFINETAGVFRVSAVVQELNVSPLKRKHEEDVSSGSKKIRSECDCGASGRWWRSCICKLVIPLEGDSEDSDDYDASEKTQLQEEMQEFQDHARASSSNLVSEWLNRSSSSEFF